MPTVGSPLDLIGHTPLLEIKKFSPGVNFFAKLESSNPLGSIKDRTAWSLIRDAENEGKLKPSAAGQKIVEATSGNTGIGLAWLARLRGYQLILTMPETMSQERRKILRFLGAKIILTAGEEGMAGALREAKEIARRESAFHPDQFCNPSNPRVHFETTGPEIWQQMKGEVDIFTCGVGTGGTLTGVGKFLKSQNSRVKIIALEPENSAVISGRKAGKHKIQGIGAGFIPDILERDLIDEIVKINDQEAIKASKKLALTEGLLLGISSGAASLAATEIAQKNPGKKIVTIFPDTGERYLSMEGFE